MILNSPKSNSFYNEQKVIFEDTYDPRELLQKSFYDFILKPYKKENMEVPLVIPNPSVKFLHQYF